ncbi:MAG: histidinol-phosphate transaminase [Deltaproteobacteria bacterium]|nr:MAG: histidinol-phosphate transaminase [Deltaproteobacteria bacterium]
MSWREVLSPALGELEPYQVARPAGCLYLDANESPVAPPLGEALERLARLPLNRYPDAGAWPLREAAARHLGVRPEQIVPGNGSDEVLSILMTAVGRGTGGAPAKVAFPGPTFSMYRIQATALGLDPVEIPTGPRFELDLRDLGQRLRALRPALFFLARPNNPTGTLWPREAVEQAAELGSGLVVVDEAYAPFAGESLLALVEHYENVVVMRTLSKVGLAALRVGFAVASEPLARELEKVRLPYNIDALSMALAVEVLDRWDALVTPIVEEVREARAELAGGLRALGLEPFESHANLLLVRVPDAERVHLALREEGILVRNLHRRGTPLEGCLRITVGTPEQNARLLRALAGILGGTSP